MNNKLVAMIYKSSWKEWPKSTERTSIRAGDRLLLVDDRNHYHVLILSVDRKGPTVASFRYEADRDRVAARRFPSDPTKGPTNRRAA